MMAPGTRAAHQSISSSPPAFFQTSWFRALCVFAAASLLWILYRLRLRHVALEIHSRLEERLAERERIARELHDTLLKGIQGLILRFQAAAKKVSPTDPARRAMEDALDRADEVMIEGWDRVRGLRNHAETAFTLPQALSTAGEELSRDYPGTMFRVVVEGIPRELHPVLGEEACRIGREAIVNAFCHAAATEIEVEVAYKRAEWQLRVRDDGRGIDSQVLSFGSRSGHWGITGMRERAQKLGAHLEIASRPQAGTEVELRIPGALAYRNKSMKFLRPRRRALEHTELK
jgi:signal transduction histidine kinase